MKQADAIGAILSFLGLIVLFIPYS
jgi:hypothetical protein